MHQQRYIEQIHLTFHNCQDALYFIKQLQQSFVIVTKQ